MKNQYKIFKTIIQFTFSIALLGTFFSCDYEGYEYSYKLDRALPPTIAEVDPLVAYEGLTVTITGDNFTIQRSNNKVRFNGIDALVATSNDSILTVVVPEGATTGPVTVSHYEFTATGPNITIVPAPVTLNIPIDTSSDDVEEGVTGNTPGEMSLSSSDLELGETEGSLGVGNIGLRFNNVTIPPGANILSAYVQFTVDNTGSNPVELTIYGENTANAVTYEDINGNLSARPLTNANVVWDIPGWFSTGDADEAQRTVDLSTIVTEITERVDWESGNSLNIIMKPTGDTLDVTSSSGGREAESFDGTAAPVLVVTYQHL